METIWKAREVASFEIVWNRLELFGIAHEIVHEITQEDQCGEESLAKRFGSF